MSEAQVDQWTIDFAQAKIALRNLEVLVKVLTQGQMDVAVKLKTLFEQYATFVGTDATEAQKEALAHQISLFERIEHNLHSLTAKFSGKAAAQLDSARSQVNVVYHNLGKLRSLKPPQHAELLGQLTQQVPEFLNLFDAFLARFTLELRLQQADYYKQLGSAFTHAGQPEPIKTTVQNWLAEYEQIMPAVEALKLVKPQPEHAKPPGHELTKPDSESSQHFTTEKVDSVLFAPVKWIHSKVGKELKDFKFSDPRRGFFNKPTQPPKHEEEVVRAVYDFKGEAESDLVFKRGDIISLVDRGTEDDTNWWCGELDGKRGLFPRNYVEEIPAGEQRHVKQKEEHHPDEYIPRVEKASAYSEEHPPPKPARPHKTEEPEESELHSKEPTADLDASDMLKTPETLEKTNEAEPSRDDANPDGANPDDAEPDVTPNAIPTKPSEETLTEPRRRSPVPEGEHEKPPSPGGTLPTNVESLKIDSTPASPIAEDASSKQGQRADAKDPVSEASAPTSPTSPSASSPSDLKASTDAANNDNDSDVANVHPSKESQPSTGEGSHSHHETAETASETDELL